MTSSDRGAINSGETQIGLDITGPSYQDTWTFNGTAGDEVLITAVTTSGALNTRIVLYPPGGGAAEAATSCTFGDCGDLLDYQLKNTGLYTIVIYDSGSNGWFNNSGQYDISLSKLPSTIPPGLYNPFPANGAMICGLNDSFRWDPVAGAIGYDLYFGEDVVAPLVKIGDYLSTNSMPFPAMDLGKTYYWYVVAHTPGGDIMGPVWWFQVSYTADTFSCSPGFYCARPEGSCSSVGSCTVNRIPAQRYTIQSVAAMD